MSPSAIVKEATTINKLLVLAASCGPVDYAQLERFCTSLGIPILCRSYFFQLLKEQGPQVQQIEEESNDKLIELIVNRL